MTTTLECVVNVSEGRDEALLDRLDAAAGTELLDRHTDGDHHRSVFTLAGTSACRRLAEVAVAEIDLGRHRGVHPRLGAVDVVPFVPLGDASGSEAVAARDAFAQWAWATLRVPCFLFGPDRTLPQVRRDAFVRARPDVGDAAPHPSAGAIAVGARGFLVAYNVWLRGPDVDRARRIAAEIRGPQIRALGLAVGDRVQVSMNLIEPTDIGPAEAFDLVAARADVDRAELVGLLPASVLARVPENRWAELDLAADRTIEVRLARTAIGPTPSGDDG